MRSSDAAILPEKLAIYLNGIVARQVATDQHSAALANRCIMLTVPQGYSCVWA